VTVIAGCIKFKPNLRAPKNPAKGEVESKEAGQIAPLQNRPRQYRPHIYQNRPH